MNRGEWSEPYVALKLLGDQKIYMADEHGNINLSEWMTVLRLVRQETKERQVSYTCSIMAQLSRQKFDIFIMN